MSENKTKPTEIKVASFIQSIENAKRREECIIIDKIMQEICGCEGKMWGKSIVGYGSYQYQYANGRKGDWFLVGFSPRKQALTLYIMNGFTYYSSLMTQLGKHKTGKSCLYINKLEDIDLNVLKELVKESVDFLRTRTK